MRHIIASRSVLLQLIYIDKLIVSSHLPPYRRKLSMLLDSISAVKNRSDRDIFTGGIFQVPCDFRPTMKVCQGRIDTPPDILA